MINSNQTALLELVKCSLFGTAPDFPADTDWGEVYKEASSQTVVALTKVAVPESAAGLWEEAASQSVAHYMRSMYEQTNLIKLLTDNGIPLVIIKGSAAAVYYPKPQLRTMGDVDFLVPEEYFDAARELLDGNGYAFVGDQDGREYDYQKGGVLFELHRRYSDKEYDIEQMIIGGMENAVVRSLNGQSFPMLPEYVNGLVLLDHIRHHLHCIGMRQIIDWMMFAQCALSDENYAAHFLPLVKDSGLVTFCETVTKMC